MTTPHTNDLAAIARHKRIEAALASWAARHGHAPPIDYAARYRRRWRRRARPGPQPVREVIASLFDVAERGQG